MIPAILNAEAGSAAAARAALEETNAFEVRERSPDDVPLAVRAAVLEGHRRIAVGGGDGTIASAAGVLAGTGVELAVIPGGTLNHFARDHAIPEDPAAAARLAAEGAARAVDVGRVNGRVFVNTSSVGAYVAFVRMRERMERSVGYTLGSLLAAARIGATMHRVAVEVATEEGARIFRSPLLFIGVGEREIRLPQAGARKPDGVRGLHLMIVRGRRPVAVLRLALAAALRGRSDASGHGIVEMLTDSCLVTVRRTTRVALDGELASLVSPLRYEYLRDSLRVVLPPAT